MKKNLIIMVALIVIILFFSVGQAQNSNNIINEDFIIKTIRTILLNRMDIMNSCIYEGLDLDIVKEKLIKIEDGTLVKDDLEYLTYLKENSTDFEFVNDLRILNISLIDNDIKKISFIAEIEWDIKFYENDLTEVVKYKIELLKSDNKFLLTKFKPLS
ncbi:hypothetical protein TR13x_00170 [Caloranaerobacter sp. TR13]|uniref:hypothetical protein n=1 Tax=Caloranaerobacter sp. TR13 TaxID=1302151 RepID=UPI0006D40994|nr:hypothetical protein [Caloranaerobacter sp. TR13]KPU27819.1 hypothetical protein TR13x_00170 [Caloranaerobacter sp. TR13]